MLFVSLSLVSLQKNGSVWTADRIINCRSFSAEVPMGLRVSGPIKLITEKCSTQVVAVKVMNTSDFHDISDRP